VVDPITIHDARVFDEDAKTIREIEARILGLLRKQHAGLISRVRKGDVDAQDHAKRLVREEMAASLHLFQEVTKAEWDETSCALVSMAKGRLAEAGRLMRVLLVETASADGSSEGSLHG
jgi:hypothetical protein